MRILVTGGAGFIGRHVVSALVAEGHQVRIMDSLVPGVHGGAPQVSADAEFLRGDLRDQAVLDKALSGIDVVCHQAAMVGRGREILDASLYAGSNVLGTTMLLTAMMKAGIQRMLLASSVVIYGDSRYDCPIHGRVRPRRRSASDLDAGRFEPRCPQCGETVSSSAVEEDDYLDPPQNVYAVTKLAQEHLVAVWAKETGSQAVALRYHNVYGPDMPFDSPYSGVASTFRSDVAAGRAPRVFEDGGSCRDFIHVADVARANLAGLRSERTDFRAYNVATGTPHTVYQLAQALADAGGGPAPLITGEYRVGDVRHIYASPARLTAELGWRASIGFAEGVREFATAPMRNLPATR